jgi:hypothetical protein
MAFASGGSWLELESVGSSDLLDTATMFAVGISGIRIQSSWCGFTTAPANISAPITEWRCAALLLVTTHPATTTCGAALETNASSRQMETRPFWTMVGDVRARTDKCLLRRPHFAGSGVTAWGRPGSEPKSASRDMHSRLPSGDVNVHAIPPHRSVERSELRRGLTAEGFRPPASSL